MQHLQQLCISRDQCNGLCCALCNCENLLSIKVFGLSQSVHVSLSNELSHQNNIASLLILTLMLLHSHRLRIVQLHVLEVCQKTRQQCSIHIQGSMCACGSSCVTTPLGVSLDLNGGLW